MSKLFINLSRLYRLSEKQLNMYVQLFIFLEYLCLLFTNAVNSIIFMKYEYMTVFNYQLTVLDLNRSNM